jgi:hypothetical protein
MSSWLALLEAEKLSESRIAGALLGLVLADGVKDARNSPD